MAQKVAAPPPEATPESSWVVLPNSQAPSQRVHTANWTHKFYSLGSVARQPGAVITLGLSPNLPQRRLYAGFRYTPTLTNNIAASARVDFKYQGATVLRVPIDTRLNTLQGAAAPLESRLSLSFDYLASGTGTITPAAGEMAENLLFVQGAGATEYFSFAPHHFDVTADSVELVVDQYTPVVDTGFYGFCLLGVYSDAGRE